MYVCVCMYVQARYAPSISHAFWLVVRAAVREFDCVLGELMREVYYTHYLCMWRYDDAYQVQALKAYRW